jgi:AcrR family transcriptional regulator
VAKLRWGANAPDDTRAARELLIDAAETCFQRFGVNKTTIEDVAATAKVSRATVYRYFVDRDDLILGVVLREAERFLQRMSSRVDRASNFGDGLVDFAAYTLRAVRADANLALLFAPEIAGVTTSVAGASKALFSMVTDFLRPYFEAADKAGVLRPGLDLDDAAEWTLRTTLSLMTVEGPRPRTEAQLKDFLRTFLVPVLLNETPTRPRRRRQQLSARG